MTKEDVIAQGTSDWSYDSWLENKRKLRDSIWLEGALLKHSDEKRVWLAPEPTQYGIVYEIMRDDIMDAQPTGRSLQKFKDTYKITRLYIKENAVVARVEYVLAITLPKEARQLRSFAEEVEQDVAGDSLASQQLKDLIIINGAGGGPTPTPTPTPKPGVPIRRPPSAASGVRG